jgi:hypothetical protein
MTAGWLLLPVVVALVVVTARYVRRRVTHPFTKAQVDAAGAQSRMLSRTSRDGVGGENGAPWMPGFPYEPRDASFLGKPVDYVVFDGLRTVTRRRAFGAAGPTNASVSGVAPGGKRLGLGDQCSHIAASKSPSPRVEGRRCECVWLIGAERSCTD